MQDKKTEMQERKKQKSFAYDDNQINSQEEELSPEILEYLKGVATRREDNSINYIN